MCKFILGLLFLERAIQQIIQVLSEVMLLGGWIYSPAMLLVVRSHLGPILSVSFTGLVVVVFPKVGDRLQTEDQSFSRLSEPASKSRAPGGWTIDKPVRLWLGATWQQHVSRSWVYYCYD